MRFVRLALLARVAAVASFKAPLLHSLPTRSSSSAPAFVRMASSNFRNPHNLPTKVCDVCKRSASHSHASRTPPRATAPPLPHRAPAPEPRPHASCRPFTWRKKWENCWDDVKTCSKRCQSERKGSRKKGLAEEDEVAPAVSADAVPTVPRGRRKKANARMCAATEAEEEAVAAKSRQTAGARRAAARDEPAPVGGERSESESGADDEEEEHDEEEGEADGDGGRPEGDREPLLQPLAMVADPKAARKASACGVKCTDTHSATHTTAAPRTAA